MHFRNTLGNDNLKNVLVNEVNTGKIPHAQLFSGHKGSGQLPMALAFVMYLFCKNKKSTDSCGSCSNCTKMLKLCHPDLHFFYPTTNSSSRSGSKELFEVFQQMVLKNPYAEKVDWYEHNNIRNRGEIKVSDIKKINTIANLKSYTGEYTVFIIWRPETMNLQASNKLLKNIEEPNPKTLFILITEDPNTLIPTIVSRLQIKSFEKITESLLVKNIQKTYPDLSTDLVEEIIKENEHNYNNIIHSINGKMDKKELHNNFITWVRLCFLSNVANKKSVPKLIRWCNNINLLNQSDQLVFIKEATRIFRYAFLLPYNPPFTLKPNISHEDFNITTFSQHINVQNIHKICTLLDEAHYCITRYANSKILFLDLSFNLGKLLHKKSSQ